MTSNVPGEVSSLHAEYYYFPGHDNCYRAGLRISWTAPRNGSLFSFYLSRKSRIRIIRILRISWNSQILTNFKTANKFYYFINFYWTRCIFAFANKKSIVPTLRSFTVYVYSTAKILSTTRMHINQVDCLYKDSPKITQRIFMNFTNFKNFWKFTTFMNFYLESHEFSNYDLSLYQPFFVSLSVFLSYTTGLELKRFNRLTNPYQ